MKEEGTYDGVSALLDYIESNVVALDESHEESEKLCLKAIADFFAKKTEKMEVETGK